MASLSGMEREKRHRKPSAGANVRLVPKLDSRMRAWLAEHATSHHYFGRRLGIEPFAAALIAWFLSRPEREQHAILTDALPPLEELERAWNREQDAREVGQSPPAHETTSGHGARHPRAAGGRKRA